MNEGLFKKYTKVLTQKYEEKEDVLVLIKEITGIILTTKEVEINKKIISFSISSVKRNILLQRNIQSKLQEKGYQIKL